MQIKPVLHKGLLTQCAVCRPDSRTTEEDRKFRRKHTGEITADVAVRRALDAEIGPEGVRPEQSASLAQKYGVVPTRLDRKVNRRNWRKPYWMGETEWRRNQSKWLEWTKGLVPRFQNPLQKSPLKQASHKAPRRDTRTSPRNSGRTRTETRPN
jgi:hypothetical protein